MKRSLAVVLTTSLLLGPWTSAHAEEANLKPKSIGIAIALGLDPIPADALFYAGKPVQGVISGLLGSVGAALFYMGLFSQGKGCHEEFCIGNKQYAIVGAVMYAPALIWDGIGGISGVREHNRKIQEQQTSWYQTIRPEFATNGRDTYAGVRLSF